MYSDIKSVQLLVALLKQYNISKVVVSPGNRNVPIVHSLEQDPFFTTYSVVDERSAGFFGIGLIQRYREPVAICCTSGTAVCNYYSAIAEAYYQKLPLLVISADRNPYYLNQDEEQMVPQTEGFTKVTKAIVNLPMCRDTADERVCYRKICEAILELNHHGCGPVQINVPMETQISSFHTPELPDIRAIQRHHLDEDWSALADMLRAHKVLVLYGQASPLSTEETALVEEFARKTGAVIAVDVLSNLQCAGTIPTFHLSRVITEEFFIQNLKPDIVITLNSGYITYIRRYLKCSKATMAHWAVNENGNITDTFQCISDVFEASPLEFMKKIAETIVEKIPEENDYFLTWKEQVNRLDADTAAIPYSNLLLAREFCGVLPKHSKLHVANSSSVRMIAHFDLDPSVEVFCNRGTNGIDGSVSAYVAMAATSDAPAYLLVGDLSFFYDMNALWNNYISPNMRIVLNNNAGATLFHYTVGKENVPTLNQNIAAEHNATAKGWVESRGFDYLAVNCESELKTAMDELSKSTRDKPLFVEVFTDKESDACVLRKFYEGDTRKAPKDVGKAILKSIFSR